MKLSILIATVNEREQMFAQLKQEFARQIMFDYKDQVELISISDDKELSIGSKRQQLLEKATGDWIVFFDDDDWPYKYYVHEIMQAILTYKDIDCIGINVFMTTDGKRPQKCCHRLLYPVWQDNKDGWDYVRNITHFNPVRREFALTTGFKDMRFGEDKDYSDRLFPLLTKEHYIELPLFHYRYTTKIPHQQKYGFKR